MTKQEIKEILRQQLELLAEQSKKCPTDDDLVMLTQAMCEISRILLEP